MRPKAAQGGRDPVCRVREAQGEQAASRGSPRSHAGRPVQLLEGGQVACRLQEWATSVVLLGTMLFCPTLAGWAQTPLTQESLTKQLTDLGVSPKQVAVDADAVCVVYENTTPEKDVVVFGAALRLLGLAAAPTQTLNVTAEHGGTRMFSVKIKPTKVAAFVADLLTERQRARVDALLAGHATTEGQVATETAPAAQSAPALPATSGASETAPRTQAPERAVGPRAATLVEPDRESAQPALGVTFHGPTGLIRTPNAETLPGGTVRLSVTWPPQAPLPPGTTIPLEPDLQRRRVFGVGLLPGVEGGVALNRDPTEDLDITIHGKVRLLKEGRYQPAVAVGASNLRASVGEPNYYLAASKTLFGDRLRASAGWSHGSIDGPFGGVEVRLLPWATGIAEYDSDRINTGLRLTPTRRLQVDLANMKGGLGTQAAYAFEMGSDVRERPGVELKRSPAGGNPDVIAGRLADAVLALGMENVQVVLAEGPEGLVAGITYENRRYYRNQLEALGMVLATAAQTSPERVVAVSVVILNHDVPVLRFGTDLKDYLAYVRGDLPTPRYAEMISVDHGTRPLIHPSTVVATTRRRARTRLTADLSLTPLVRMIVGSERFDLAVRTAALPQLDVDLGRGWELSAAKEFRLTGNLGAFNGYFSNDQLSANYVSRLGPQLVTHIAGGEFADKRLGGAAEAFWLPGGSPLLVRGVAGRLQDRRFGFSGDWNSTYLGDVRYWLGGDAAELGVTFGRYLDGDTGFAVSAGKFFGDDELRLEFRDTDFAKVLMAQVTLPLGPDRFPKPHGFRVRWGDHVQAGWRAIAGSQGNGQIAVAAVTGNQLRLFDLSDTYLDRDRFNPSAVRHGLDILRSAAAVRVRTSVP